MDYKKTITRKEYYILAGLLHLGIKFSKKTDEINNSFADIMESTDKYGLWSDDIYSDQTEDIDYLLERMEVEVIDDTVKE